MAAELSKEQVNDYKSIVKYVKSNLETCFEVGIRLQRMKEEKLFLAGGYKSFDECCEAEFSMSKRHANRLISSVEVIDTIGQSGTPGSQLVPVNEKQTRELAKAEPEKQPEVWAKAVEKANADTPPDEPMKQPTAAQVREAVKESTSATPVDDGGSETEGTPTSPKDGAIAHRKDKEGEDLPGSLWVTFDSLPIFDEAVNAIKDADDAVKRLIGYMDGGLQGKSHLEERVRLNLKQAKGDLNAFRPHAVCGRCKGVGCKYCNDTGYLIQSMHKRLMEAQA